jgi:hypothetical protein
MTTVDDYARFLVWASQGAGLPRTLFEDMSRREQCGFQARLGDCWEFRKPKKLHDRRVFEDFDGLTGFGALGGQAHHANLVAALGEAFVEQARGLPLEFARRPAVLDTFDFVEGSRP